MNSYHENVFCNILGWLSNSAVRPTPASSLSIDDFLIFRNFVKSNHRYITPYFYIILSVINLHFYFQILKVFLNIDYSTFL